MFTENNNDQEIIDGLKAGASSKRKAEDKLFNQYSYFVREGMKKHSLPEEDCIDAYSDTILYTIQAITNGVYRGEAKLKSYIFRIFSNKCVDLFRKKSTYNSKVNKAGTFTEILFQMSDSAKSVLEKLMLEYDLAELEKKFRELGENCRRLLRLMKDDYTPAEIRDIMGYKTEEVVRNTRLRCIQQLRELYKGR